MCQEQIITHNKAITKFKGIYLQIESNNDVQIVVDIHEYGNSVIIKNDRRKHPGRL